MGSCPYSLLRLIMNQEKTMPDMADEEYDALDEYLTKNTPKLSGNGKSGFFAKNSGHVIFVDDLSANWLRIKAEFDLGNGYFMLPSGTKLDGSLS